MWDVVGRGRGLFVRLAGPGLGEKSVGLCLLSDTVLSGVVFPPLYSRVRQLAVAAARKCSVSEAEGGGSSGAAAPLTFRLSLTKRSSPHPTRLDQPPNS